MWRQWRGKTRLNEARESNGSSVQQPFLPLTASEVRDVPFRRSRAVRRRPPRARCLPAIALDRGTSNQSDVREREPSSKAPAGRRRHEPQGGRRPEAEHRREAPSEYGGEETPPAGLLSLLHPGRCGSDPAEVGRPEPFRRKAGEEAPPPKSPTSCPACACTGNAPASGPRCFATRRADGSKTLRPTKGSAEPLSSLSDLSPRAIPIAASRGLRGSLFEEVRDSFPRPRHFLSSPVG